MYINAYVEIILLNIKLKRYVCYHLSCYNTYICNIFTNERKSSTQPIAWPRDIDPDLRLHKTPPFNTQSYNGITVINECAGVFDNQDKNFST